ncbi:MAG: hypothetical protein EA360_03245 [Balneolaceae bacterium]|nr:MAG: hypothetical protein EA360_03245 [Balneolaceae bacterium]
MKSFLNKLNYSTATSDEGEKLEYYTIVNPDGSPRWIFPVHADSPLFLKFYHVEGWRSKLFALVSSIVFHLRLQHFVYQKNHLFITRPKGDETPRTDLITDTWALFTGTPGPNNKMVLYTESENGSRFLKIPVTGEACETVEREFSGTSGIRSLNPEHVTIPAATLYENGILELEDAGSSGTRSNIFSGLHKSMLTEICTKTAVKLETSESPGFNKSLKRLGSAKATRDERIPRALINRLSQLGSELAKSKMVFTMSHGDFTPWNMFITDGKLAVYDWELADDSTPLGFDAFHFIIQKGVLIDHKSWKEIRNEIDILTGKWGHSLSEKYGVSWSLCLKFYLFMNISNHLYLYSRQEKWHKQIDWLLDTWNEALSEILSDNREARGLLIEDLFCKLNNKPYSAIKFPEKEPSELDAYSDIDLCLKKETAGQLIEYLKRHTLADKVLVKRSSFMASVQIQLKNNDILNLDLIWQFKWKHLEMMSAEGVLHRSQRNRYGIKTMHPSDLVHYLGLFYGLNGSLIPDKQAMYLTSVNTTGDSLTRLILTGNADGRIPRRELLESVESRSVNQGLSRVIQRVHYLRDILKSLFRSKGMIITFSGVDGAGKSTVIEHIHREFDKKLRKRVVILRHRPSLLPILSAWTKGKVIAEQDAANTLPRQGSNRNVISSLLRFLYYYTDYLAGQFVVYFRHVLRGDVVLYDRYYFDFINDSVRSNIHLPETLLRAGYLFLMKPDFNFFLYADAATILARKQELDKETITELTSKYIDLFRKLDSGRPSAGKYLPVLNIDLDATILTIMNTTQKRAA